MAIIKKKPLTIRSIQRLKKDGRVFYHRKLTVTPDELLCILRELKEQIRIPIIPQPFDAWNDTRWVEPGIGVRYGQAIFTLTCPWGRIGDILTVGTYRDKKVTVVVTSVQVQRLNDIPFADACYEGHERECDNLNKWRIPPDQSFIRYWDIRYSRMRKGTPYRNSEKENDPGEGVEKKDYKWDSNPYVWKIEFKLR